MAAGHVVRERRGRGGRNLTYGAGFGDQCPTIERRPHNAHLIVNRAGIVTNTSRLGNGQTPV